MKAILILSLMLVVVLAGCTSEVNIVKENDMCSLDADCNYFGFAGSCHTQEYVDKVLTACEEKTGPCPSETSFKEGVTCSCVDNYCFTND